jgi:hypothetical protein
MGDQGGQARQPGVAGYQAWRLPVFTGTRLDPVRAPGARISIWTYVAGRHGEFEIAVRYSYSTSVMPRWTYDGWLCGRDTRQYGTFREALAGAFAEAQYIAQGTPEVQAAYPEIFDWDGTAW